LCWGCVVGGCCKGLEQARGGSVAGKGGLNEIL